MKGALRDLVDHFPIETLEERDLVIALQRYKSKLLVSNPFSNNRLPNDTISLILEQLSVRDIISFSQVCRSTRRFYRSSLAHLVKKFISPYISPPKLFLLMRKTWSVLSGSSVLWLLDGFPTRWTPKDLDVYCPLGSREYVVKFWKHEGYTVTYHGNVYVNPEYPHRGRQMSSLRTITKLERGKQRIDVLESRSSSAVEPIHFFHSTVVMNFISADFIVSLSLYNI